MDPEYVRSLGPLFGTHAMLAAVGILIVLFFYRVLLKARTVRFEIYEILYFIVPFSVMVYLRSPSGGGKSLANFVAEFWLIGVFIPLGMVIRIHLGKYIGRHLAFCVALVALSIVSILIFRYMPDLPE